MTPTRLYKFLNKDFGLAAIRDKRIKISRLNELNDPFEFLGLALKDRKDRFVLQKTKDDLSGKHGLICLSANWSHPLMWGHYADRHRGLCLGFDIVGAPFHPVTYSKRRLTLNELGVAGLHEIREEHIIKLLFYKFAAWGYEKEYRAHTTIDEKDDSGLAFLDFSDQFSIREIVVGSACDLSRSELQLAAANYGPDIEIKRARLAFKSFMVVEQKSRRIW